MFIEKLKCDNCKRNKQNENITIHTNTEKLNGITNLKVGLKSKVLCETCSK